MVASTTYDDHILGTEQLGLNDRIASIGQRVLETETVATGEAAGK